MPRYNVITGIGGDRFQYYDENDLAAKFEYEFDSKFHLIDYFGRGITPLELKKARQEFSEWYKKEQQPREVFKYSMWGDISELHQPTEEEIFESYVRFTLNLKNYGTSVKSLISEQDYNEIKRIWEAKKQVLLQPEKEVAPPEPPTPPVTTAPVQKGPLPEQPPSSPPIMGEQQTPVEAQQPVKDHQLVQPTTRTVGGSGIRTVGGGFLGGLVGAGLGALIGFVLAGPPGAAIGAIAGAAIGTSVGAYFGYKSTLSAAPPSERRKTVVSKSEENISKPTEGPGTAPAPVLGTEQAEQVNQNASILTQLDNAQAKARERGNQPSLSPAPTTSPTETPKSRP